MRVTYQLALVPLTFIFSLAFIVDGIPHQESAVDAPKLFGRDDTANYVVYPKNTTDQDQAKAIQTLLEGVVSDPTTIYVSSTNHSSNTWFWGVPLTSGNAQKVGADSNVRMSSHFRSKGCRTDESRSLQLFKNVHRTVVIQQGMMTNLALKESAQTAMPSTRRDPAS